MSDLVGNPEDRFSRVEAHLMIDLNCCYARLGSIFQQMHSMQKYNFSIVYETVYCAL